MRDVRLGLQEGGATRFVLELGDKADYHLFLLDNPRRAVIDLPTLAWPDGLPPEGRGVVKGWRYGQFGEGTRVVLDLSAPVAVKTSKLLPPRSTGEGPRLMVDLMPSADLDVKQTWGERIKATPASFSIPLPPALPKRRQPEDLRPMVVIDPGHGGVDPGAIAVDGTREKVITLAVARRLAARLESSGHYRVALTRDRDRFIPLRERTKIARRLEADLFISLHADSIRNKETRGLSIYTLSDKASDAEAAALAESENRVDQMAGLDAAGEDEDVASIFINMSQRASLNGSRQFSRHLHEDLGRQVTLLEQPERAAGFAVLKAPDIPAALVEMGYLSSRSEARLLQQKDHQQKIVTGIERAVDDFFADRLALMASARTSAGVAP